MVAATGLVPRAHDALARTLRLCATKVTSLRVHSAPVAKPVEFTLGQLASRWFPHLLIACGIALWAGFQLLDAVRTGATYVKVTGGGFSVTTYVTFVGVGMTILGGILLASSKPSPPAEERIDRDRQLKSSGTTASARVEAIHAKTRLYGPWVEIYATLDVKQPAYTAKTTVVLNTSDLRSFKPGAVVSIRFSSHDRDDIAVTG
jgi:hypothetical protein